MSLLEDSLPRPAAWAMRLPGCDGSADWAELGEAKPAPCQPAVAHPLYDQAALDAARDEGHAIGREAEAEYWRSMVERLTAQADAWNARYMELVQQVADGRAMQLAPAVVVVTGPNEKGNRPA